MSALDAVRADLAAECQSLDTLVAGLDEAGWATPTPAEGWTVKDQISHLASVDEWAARAAGDPDGFAAWMAAADLHNLVEGPVDEARSRPGAAVLAWWREARGLLDKVLERADPERKIPWFGPPMAPATFVTARLMETWAHGEDVAEALGIERPVTPRLRHVAHLGVRTRGYAFASRGLPVPTTEVRVELTGPGGEVWSWGDEGAGDHVRGPALDFCRVVTRRRHVADTALEVQGEGAAAWMQVAQAFAGPAGKDPIPQAG